MKVVLAVARGCLLVPAKHILAFIEPYMAALYWPFLKAKNDLWTDRENRRETR